jgi:hypothetical protein
MGRLDIASVAIKGRAGSPSAIEGPDAIRRGSGSPSNSFTVVKVAKPQRTCVRRAPVGLGTIESSPPARVLPSKPEDHHRR